MTAPATAPLTSQAGSDDGLDHITLCHDDNKALCGEDLSDTPWGDCVNPCVVCHDLDEFHCGCDCGCCDEDEPA